MYVKLQSPLSLVRTILFTYFFVHQVLFGWAFFTRVTVASGWSCLSVRPSDTSWCSTETTESRITQTTPRDRTRTL